MGLPALLLFLAFYLYPALQNLQFATRRWDGITEPEFAGFRNFTNLLTNDDLFFKTFRLIVIILTVSYFIGMFWYIYCDLTLIEPTPED